MTTTTAPEQLAPERPRPALGDRARTAALRLVRGRPDAAKWERPALLALLALTALLYFWDLTVSGWANSFYSAAAQAGSVNWEAFFYGSSDAGNSITVDKPPASLWLMALSVRLFGLSSFSILLPEALMGVATVGVLYATLRRRFSAGTALLGGAVLALTPVAALMFRYNNPDALLVLLITLAAYFTLRAIDDGKLRWMLWAGAMVGLGFLTKQLQVLLIVPPIALAFLWASPLRFGKRMLHGLAAVGAMVVSAGWWVAIVELVPASLRPYIGGSQTNSFWDLTFGYNGFGRLTGNEVGSVTGGGGNSTGTSMWGATGIFRMFENEVGGQIAWLLPAALVLVVVGYLLIGRAPRTSPQRASLTLFAGWMLVTAVAFSFMAGIFHAYYTVALAPAIAAVVAIGASLLWTRRSAAPARIALAALVLVTGGWAWALLSEASTWMPALKVVVVVLAVIGAGLLLVPPRTRLLSVATATIALAAVLLAPAACTIETVTTAHSGGIVTAGPAVAGGFGGPGGGAGGPRGGFGGAPQGAPGGQTGAPPTGAGPAGGQGGAFGGGPGGGPGGLLGASSVSSTLAKAISSGSSSYTWAAAAVGSNSAAGYQLATGLAVMPLGGFNGSDPSPTLAQFKKLVADHEIHWFIGGSVGAANGGSSASSSIATWVAAHFTATTVDGVTLYDLS